MVVVVVEVEVEVVADEEGVMVAIVVVVVGRGDGSGGVVEMMVIVMVSGLVALFIGVFCPSYLLKLWDYAKDIFLQYGLGRKFYL